MCWNTTLMERRSREWESEEEEEEEEEDPINGGILKNNKGVEYSEEQVGFMKKLREAMIELASSELGRPLSPHQISHIQFRLPEIILAFHSPHLPPYSQMICKAIEALKEEGGSSRERISDYIESHNFQDHLHLLPWAHHNLVSYHLQKLVKRGEILALTNNNNNNTYSLIPKTKDDDETEEGGMVMEAKGRRRRPRKNY